MFEVELLLPLFKDLSVKVPEAESSFGMTTPGSTSSKDCKAFPDLGMLPLKLPALDVPVA